MIYAYFSPDSDKMIFIWKKQYNPYDSYFSSHFNCLKLKGLDGFVFCGLLWCFYQLFGLSFWRHPFTAEDPLVSKWCNATFLQIWWRNKLTYMWPWITKPVLSRWGIFVAITKNSVNVQQLFIFGQTLFFLKSHLNKDKHEKYRHIFEMLF